MIVIAPMGVLSVVMEVEANLIGCPWCRMRGNTGPGSGGSRKNWSDLCMDRPNRRRVTEDKGNSGKGRHRTFFLFISTFSRDFFGLLIGT